ncbi:MAG: sulfatase-like hydrolase/transferase [Rubripirellula sp.]|nr:sulfatase-like hydrolase/transferase [Rubripirellula sp.]
MTSRILFSTLAVQIFWLSLSTFCMAAPNHRLPNIILIFSDDQGMHDVGCYGSEIMTPRLDQLAKDGMRFTQFYAASSICTPSRYGLMTGRYPHRSKDQLLGALMFLADEDKQRGIHPGETTYVSQLNETGYQTALVGKWHLGHGTEAFWPTRHGFETFFGHTGGCIDFFTLNYGNRPDWYRNSELEKPDGYATDVITDEAIKILRQSKTADRPLYLHVAYNAPHFGKGWNAAKQTTENVMQPKQEDIAQVAHISAPLRRAFAAKVVGMDKGIGKLLDVVDELEMRENTLVIFMTDHGGDPDYGGSNTPFRGRKATLFEGGIRVPCIARWPQQIPANSVSPQVACAIDLYATFSELAGYENKGSDGISMLPILLGKSSPLPRTLIWKTGSHQSLGRQSWQAVRDGEWKWVSQPGKQSMLFDLGNDPHETSDVADSNPNVARRLQALSE